MGWFPPLTFQAAPSEEMKKEIVKKGYGFALRPVREADAEFILHLRTMPHVHGNVGDTVPDVAGQLRWLKAYFLREGDHYFIIETMAGVPVGTVGVYDLKDGTAEWGRWIIVPGVPAAIPSAVLIHQLAFDNLGLRELRGCVVSTNKKVLSFHRRFGSVVTSIEKGARRINGCDIDLVWILMDKPRWRERSPKLCTLAEFSGASQKSQVLI